MAKRIYLADTENEGGRRYTELLKKGLGKEEELYLVYTENSPRVDFGDVDAILKNAGKIKTERAFRGTNGLDFQLTSILGYLIAKGDASTEYTILSNDHGYDPCVAYWVDKGAKVTRLGYFVNNENAQSANKETVNESTKPEKEKEDLPVMHKRIIEVLKKHELTGYDVQKIADAMSMAGAKRGAAMNEYFGWEKANEFFQAISKSEKKAIVQAA